MTITESNLSETPGAVETIPRKDAILTTKLARSKGDSSRFPKGEMLLELSTNQIEKEKHFQVNPDGDRHATCGNHKAACDT